MKRKYEMLDSTTIFKNQKNAQLRFFLETDLLKKQIIRINTRRSEDNKNIRFDSSFNEDSSTNIPDKISE